jgi:oligopeptide transport system substrate-binding protein
MGKDIRGSGMRIAAWVLGMALLGCAVSAGPASAAARVLHVMLRNEPTTFDPPLINSAQDFEIMWEVLEGLTGHDADGHVVPGAAESWEVSSDGRLYTFHLRDDAQWDDGVTVTADQFVAAARRWIDPKTASGYTTPIESVENAQAIQRGGKAPEELGVSAPDPHTLIIRLVRPDPYLLDTLADYLMPIRPDLIERWGRGWTRPGHMPSNGPFQLSEWVPQGHVTLVRNPHYRAAARVRLDRIEFTLVDPEAALKMYTTQEMDLVRLPPQQYREAMKVSPDAVSAEPTSGNLYLQLNLATGPLTDRRTRRALALALDQRTLYTTIAPGAAQPAFSLIPALLRPPGAVDADYIDRPMPDRIAEAKRLMAEAGYAPDHRASLSLTYPTDRYGIIPQAMQKMWETALPVQVKLVGEEFQAWINDRTNFDMSLDGVGLGDDPLAYVSAFRSDRPGEFTIPGYENAAMNALLDQAENQIDLAARSDLLARAEALLLADQPVIPIGSQLIDRLVSPRLQGWRPNVGDYHPLSLVSVEP